MSGFQPEKEGEPELKSGVDGAVCLGSGLLAVNERLSNDECGFCGRQPSAAELQSTGQLH